MLPIETPVISFNPNLSLVTRTDVNADAVKCFLYLRLPLSHITEILHTFRCYVQDLKPNARSLLGTPASLFLEALSSLTFSNSNVQNRKLFCVYKRVFASRCVSAHARQPCGGRTRTQKSIDKIDAPYHAVCMLARAHFHTLQSLLAQRRSMR